LEHLDAFETKMGERQIKLARRITIKGNNIEEQILSLRELEKI
jgi:hypothetical protein